MGGDGDVALDGVGAPVAAGHGEVEAPPVDAEVVPGLAEDLLGLGADADGVHLPARRERDQGDELLGGC